MSPLLVFFLACCGMGTVLGYALWSEARTVIFRDRLAAIRSHLDEAMIVAGRADDPDYQRMRYAITAAMEVVPHLSAGTLAVFIALRPASSRRRDAEEALIPDGWGKTYDAMIPPVKRAVEQMIKEIFDYFVFSSLTAMLLFVWGGCVYLFGGMPLVRNASKDSLAGLVGVLASLSLPQVQPSPIK